MTKLSVDTKLISSIILAHILLFITFHDHHAVFWYLYSGAMLFLISFSIFQGKAESNAKKSFFQFLLYGILSGIVLYLIFWIGHFLLTLLPTDLDQQVSHAYKRFSPELLWNYIVLIIILIPGEEIFWRGFVQKRLMNLMNDKFAILISALLNASVFLYADLPIMMIAAFVGSLFWGILYAKKRDLSMLILSHLIFDLLLLVIFPIH